MIELLKIHALADGEASPEELASLGEQIAACEESSRELQSVKSLKSLLTRLDAVECEQVWTLCRKRIDAIEKTRRIEATVGRYAWGLCGAFFAAIAIGGYATRSVSHSIVRSGDVPGMVSSLAAPLNFIGSRPEDAKRWLSDNTGNLPMEVPADRLQVLGGQSGYVDGHWVCNMKLRDQQGALALVVIHNVDEIDGLKNDGAFQLGQINDMNCVAWVRQHCALMLIGDRDAVDLQSVAASISVR